MKQPLLILLVAAGAAACAPLSEPAPASAAAGPAARGAVIAQARCGGCHATGREGDSPMRQAPPFRTLGERYPARDLEEALGEGVVTAHPAMPEFIFEPDEIRDLVAYLETL